jgi:hypothetical protein
MPKAPRGGNEGTRLDGEEGSASVVVGDDGHICEVGQGGDGGAHDVTGSAPGCARVARKTQRLTYRRGLTRMEASRVIVVE